MALIDQKSKVFGKVAAARTLAEGLPKLKTNPSFPSINNDGNAINFLTDMLKSLVGVERLRSIIVDTLSYKLDEIELAIKNQMKLSLKELVNCGVNPSIPAYLKSTGLGVKIEVPKVDFLDIMKVDPLSREGNFIYTDTQAVPLTNSNDYNTFLYGTIQANGSTETWLSTKAILDVKFDSVNVSPTPNNTLTFNTNPAYDNKSLTDLNNDYIDSIDLFDSRLMLNNILDDLFGAISVNLNKSRSQLQKEEEIKNVIQNIVDANEGDVIDNSYFQFSNEEVAAQESAADWRKKGINMVTSCGNAATSIPSTTLDDINTDLQTATLIEDKKNIISSGLNKLGDEIGSQAPDKKDAYALNLNFVIGLIKNLITSIIKSILSPKVITIFLLNYKIVYGLNENYDSAIDFMKQNKTLMIDIGAVVRKTIIDILLGNTLKEISNLVKATAVTIATEKAKNILVQTASLVGTPTNILRKIKGF